LATYSVQYAATVINAYHPIKDGDGNPHNRHALASGKSFEGRELVLGQLIYVRKDPLNRHKFEANAVPALFVERRDTIAAQNLTKGCILRLTIQR